MTSECFKLCFNYQKNRINQACFETCYDKYLQTLSIVTTTLKEVGYKSQSRYAYKVFPENDPWFDIIYSQMFSKAGRRDGFIIEKDYFDDSRTR